MADGLNIDTSSYPRSAPVAPMDPLGTLGKVVDIQRGQQALQSGGLVIDKQKLDLVNQRFGNMVKDFTGLINDPNLNEDTIRKRIETDVKLGVATPEMAGTFISQLPPTQGMPPQQASATLKGHLQNWLQHAMTIKEALDYHSGQQELADTGNALQPLASSPKFGIRSTGLPIQKYPAPGTTGVDANQNPVFQPPNPNAVAMPPPAPGSNIPLPIARPQGAPATFNERTGAAFPNATNPPAGKSPSFAPGPPVNFEEGKKAYNEDQALATQKLTAIKPALLALDKIPDLRSGPGTKLWNDAVAGLKANGIIPIDAKNDSTAIYQEVNKYLSQYLKGRGTRSDADLIAAEESSPNVGKQISPALLKLTQTAVAQDRIEAARANAFKGSDYQNYNKHRSTFPASMDERAFIVDKMTPEQKQDLAKQIQKMKPAEKDRFMRSLRAYEQTGVGGQ